LTGLAKLYYTRPEPWRLKISLGRLVQFLKLLGCNCDISVVWRKLETACSQHWPANVVRKN